MGSGSGGDWGSVSAEDMQRVHQCLREEAAEVTAGGLTPQISVPAEVLDFLPMAKSHIESQTSSLGMFTPLECSSQIVAGTNYFVKVRTSEDRSSQDDGSCVHLRIFKPLPHTSEPMQLVSFRFKKGGCDLSVGDVLDYF